MLQNLNTFLEYFSADTLVDIIEFVGTVAFAISGIRLASAKEFDWFGAIVVGFVTAVGGGTLRDLLLDIPPFWLQSSIYLWGTILAFILVVVFRKLLVHLNNTIFWFDCVGLGLFTVVGFEKALGAGQPFWVCIVMGTITGAFGGILRDILINEVPIIFRKELYAIACMVGGLVFVLFIKLEANMIVTQIVVFISVVLVRVLATRYHWSLPTLKKEE